MKDKFTKLAEAAKILVKQPSLINLMLNSNENFKTKFQAKYPNISALNQLTINYLCDEVPQIPVTTFFLDGGSMLTDLRLLMGLASRKDVNSYFEIGTWRGESVFNVGKILEDCTTMNLSKKDIVSLGLDAGYADQHCVLSRKNPAIKHIEANTKTFDFSKLGRTFDLIFIDGDHSYEMVKNDTQKVFASLVHEKSIVVWHDYAYSPRKIRYEVFMGILDALPQNLHKKLYHIKNTMCAVYFPFEISSEKFEEFSLPETVFDVEISEKEFRN